MKTFENISKFLFILLWDTFIENCENGWSLWVLSHVDLKIQSIFNKIKVQVDLFIIDQRPYLQCEYLRLSFLRLKVISKFSDDLIVLFLVRIFNFVD